MLSYVVHKTSVQMIHAFIKAQEIERRLIAHKMFGEEGVNCHVKSRVIGPFVRLKVVSGHYLTFMNSTVEPGKVAFCENEHSWLVWRNRFIMDVSPVGFDSDGPIIVKMDSEFPGFYNYQPLPIRKGPAAARSRRMWEKVNRIGRQLCVLLEEEPFTEDFMKRRFNQLIMLDSK